MAGDLKNTSEPETAEATAGVAVSGSRKKVRKNEQAFFANPLMVSLVLFLMCILMLPTTVFLFLSMLPTLIVAFVSNKNDDMGNRYKWLCIGGMNAAGALPYLFKMWFGDNSFDAAIGHFMQVTTIIVTYGSSMIGWVFYRSIPPLVLHFVNLSDQREVLNLKERQKKLVELWGEEVANSSDFRK